MRNKQLLFEEVRTKQERFNWLYENRRTSKDFDEIRSLEAWFLEAHKEYPDKNEFRILFKGNRYKHILDQIEAGR